MPTWTNFSKCLMTKPDSISETLCLKKPKIMGTSKTTQSSEAFKSALNSIMTLNLGVRNLAATDTTRQFLVETRWKYPRTSLRWMCNFHEERDWSFIRCDKTYIAHNRLFRETYASVRILSLNIFHAVIFEESRNEVYRLSFQDIYNKVKICSSKLR